MVDSLVKLWESGNSGNDFSDLKDLANGYQEFELICSIWDTYIYIQDHQTDKFLYISPALCNYLGLSYEKATTEGYRSIASYIHPDDLDILDNALYKKINLFLRTCPELQPGESYKYSYNFRFRKKDGSFIGMSVISKIIRFDKKEGILLDFGLITPINQLIDNDKIVLIISKSIGKDDSVTLLQQEYSRDTVVQQDFNLTERELEIIQLIKEGLDSNEMAERLCLSQHTIRNHRKNILKKTNTNKVTELLTLINKLGL
jgi:DNA-binding CsgD family transcriptional regulator